MKAKKVGMAEWAKGVEAFTFRTLHTLPTVPTLLLTLSRLCASIELGL